MRVNLREFQRIVRNAVNEERLTDALRAEVTRTLGPSVILEGTLEQLAEAANERLDVLDGTGRVPTSQFGTSLAVRLALHKSHEARKLAARMLPVNMLGRLVNDGHSAVRSAVARRVPLPAVRDMMKRFPSDDQLRHVFRYRRRLDEAGLPQPEATETFPEPPVAAPKRERLELSDQWYEDRAMLMIQEYQHGHVEFGWEERVVERYVSSMKAIQDVDINAKKLLEMIFKKTKEHEDRVLERDALRETYDCLMARADTMDEFVDNVDPVKELLEGNLTPQTYVDKAFSVFSVKRSIVPPGIRKHRIGEGSKEELVPCVGQLPHEFGFRSVDERALDRFCEYWNVRQSMIGEPLKISWDTNPCEVGRVSFNVILR